jgi:hypothetical protein
MATDLLGRGGPWAVPRACFICMRKGGIGSSRAVQPPTVRVHGMRLFMHVCDGHQREAQHVVGKPNVVARLSGPWITSDEMERENDLLLHQPQPDE